MWFPDLERPRRPTERLDHSTNFTDWEPKRGYMKKYKLEDLDEVIIIGDKGVGKTLMCQRGMDRPGDYELNPT